MRASVPVLLYLCRCVAVLPRLSRSGQAIDVRSIPNKCSAAPIAVSLVLPTHVSALKRPMCVSDRRVFINEEHLEDAFHRPGTYPSGLQKKLTSDGLRGIY